MRQTALKIQEALSSLNRFDGNGNAQTVYASLLRLCSDERSLSDGKLVHTHMNISSCNNNVVLSNLTIQMYDKCGALEEAKSVFDGIARKNTHSWGLLMSAYARKGHYTCVLDLFNGNAFPDEFMVATALRACSALGDLQQGISIHNKIKSGKLPSNFIVQTALLNMYGKCNCIDQAREVFDSILNKDVVSWNSMLSAYSQTGHSRKSVELYRQMCLDGGSRPDMFTFSSVLMACSELKDLSLGREVHSTILTSTIELDDALSTSLVHMYARCGSVEGAESVFQRSRNNVVAWTSMVTAYAQLGHPLKALDVFRRMPQVNHVSFVAALGACASMGGDQGLLFGESIHSLVTYSCSGSQLPETLSNTLINMYAKCGNIEEAKYIFDNVPEDSRSIVCWNTMLGAYAQFGEPECVSALNLFGNMGTLGTLEPDNITFVNMLSVCGKLQDLQQGKAIAAHIRSMGMRMTSLPSIKIALVNMYSRCGDVYLARRSFGAYRRQLMLGLQGCDLEPVELMAASWNAMISSFASYGHAGQSLTALKIMSLEGIQPNEITFLSVLAACSRGGTLQHGRRRFISMQEDYGIRPSVDHYRCMIHLLGRTNRLKEAEELVKNMEFEPSEVEWTILLGTCRALGNAEIGKRAAKMAMKINPESKVPVVLLSNLYYTDIQQRCHVKKKRTYRPNMKPKQKVVTGGRNWIVKPLWFREKYKGHTFTVVGRNWRYNVKNARSKQFQEVVVPKFSTCLDPETWTG